MPRGSAACLAILALLTSAPVAAQTSSDRATARVLAMDGHQALKNKDFAKAEDLLGRAYALVPGPTVGVELARAQAALGKVVSAHETYSRVIHEPLPTSASPAQIRSVDDARREFEALEPRLPSVIVTVVGSNVAELSLDGEPVSRVTLGIPRFVDPGAHVVKATAAGFAPVTEEVTLKEGESKRLELKLVALPAAELAPAADSAPADAPAATDLPAPVLAAAATAAEAPATPSGPPPAAARGLVGDAAVGFGVGSLALGAVAWFDARGLAHGAGSTTQQHDTYSRTDALGLAGLAVGVVLAGGGLALRASADGAHGSPAKELGWTLVGAGVAGVGFGVVTGLMARHVQSGLDAVCRPACPAAEGPNVGNQNTLGTWSTVGFVVGGVAAAAGIVVVATSGGDAPAPASVARATLVPYVVPYVGPGAVGLTGSF